MEQELIDRFWKSTVVNTGTKCWLYQGYKDKDGYNIVGIYKHYPSIFKDKQIKGKYIGIALSRLSLCIFLKLDYYDKAWQSNHICKNKHCWNPLHLYAGTHSENVYDSVRGGTHHRSRIMTCKNGHVFTKENTRYEISKKVMKRHCNICDKERAEKPRAVSVELIDL